jgi:hypothetical protein
MNTTNKISIAALAKALISKIEKPIAWALRVQVNNLSKANKVVAVGRAAKVVRVVVAQVWTVAMVAEVPVAAVLAEGIIVQVGVAINTPRSHV